ncbi:MAG: VWA domain-containing protein [Cardiobacteriaceae bacterium]|nr:VWA domain-containing protein [Cardiobacteriaceae bacterium]
MKRDILLFITLTIGGTVQAASRCDNLELAEPENDDNRNTHTIIVNKDASLQVDITDSSKPYAMEKRQMAHLPVKQAMTKNIAPTLQQNTEKYGHYAENSVYSTAKNPVSTFSIDVDTGSYSNIRRMLLQEHRLPPADAVRSEEIINYFDYHYPLPTDGKPFAVHTQTVDSPWQNNGKIIRIGIQATDTKADKRPAANLVFLIDTSGSMNEANKLPLVKKTVCYFAEALRPDDHIALITYAGDTRLPPTAGKDFETIIYALKQLSAEGRTAGENAIRMAYDAAEKHFKIDGINRILLATDGDFNVGINDTQALKSLVADKRKSGISLTTLGFGSDNYNDELMEQLADVGDGNYSYIDNEAEAKKVLVRQLTSTLTTIAQDVKVQVEFNPVTVKEYRLVGYENRLLQHEDFNNDQVDAGDIGADHNITALYEIIPQGQNGWLDTSHYQQTSVPQGKTDEYGWLKIRYKKPEQKNSILLEQAIPAESIPLANADENTRFAIAVASYAQALRGGKYNGKYSWTEISRLAQTAKGHDPYGERAELIQLLETAQRLSSVR